MVGEINAGEGEWWGRLMQVRGSRGQALLLETFDLCDSERVVPPGLTYAARGPSTDMLSMCRL